MQSIIVLFQRPGPDADTVSCEPELFIAPSVPGAVKLLRAHIDSEFDLAGIGDDACEEQYGHAHSFPALKQWFDKHYCYFDIKSYQAPTCPQSS